MDYPDHFQAAHAGNAKVEETPPLMRLVQRMNNAAARTEGALQATHRSLDRLSGEMPPQPTSATAPGPRGPWPFGGELAELEMAVSRAEGLAEAVEFAANRVTRLA